MGQCFFLFYSLCGRSRCLPFDKFHETASLDTLFFCVPLVPLISLFLCAEGEFWTLPHDAGLSLLACFLLALGDARGCLPRPDPRLTPVHKLKLTNNFWQKLPTTGNKTLKSLT